MSQGFYWLGAYLAISAVVGLWSWADVSRTVHGITFRRNAGLEVASFVRALIWPIYFVSVTGFLLHQNYRSWRKEKAEARRSEPVILGPDPPGRPTIGWPVYEGRSLQPARVPGPDADYGFSCAAGSSGQDGFVDLQRYGFYFVLRIRSLTQPVGEQAILLTPQQVRNVASGCLMGLAPEPEPVPPPPPPPEPERLTSWARLLGDEEP